MLAWTALTGTITRPPEIEAIMALDRAWLAAQSDGNGFRAPFGSSAIETKRGRG